MNVKIFIQTLAKYGKTVSEEQAKDYEAFFTGQTLPEDKASAVKSDLAGLVENVMQEDPEFAKRISSILSKINTAKESLDDKALSADNPCVKEFSESHSACYLPGGLAAEQEYKHRIRNSFTSYQYYAGHTSLSNNLKSVGNCFDTLLKELNITLGNPKIVYKPYAIVKDGFIRDLLTGKMHSTGYTQYNQIVHVFSQFQTNLDKKPMPESLVRLPVVESEKNTQIIFYPTIMMNACLNFDTEKELTLERRTDLDRGFCITHGISNERWQLTKTKIDLLYEFDGYTQVLLNKSYSKMPVLNLTFKEGNITYVPPDDYWFHASLLCSFIAISGLGAGCIAGGIGITNPSFGELATCASLGLGVSFSLFGILPAVYHFRTIKPEKKELANKIKDVWAKEQSILLYPESN